MRIAGWNIYLGGKKLLPVFIAGVITGIFIMSIGKSVLLEETGLFDEDTLYRMKYMTVDSNAFFCYVLRKRLLTLLVLAVLSTTYLGLAVCYGTAAWYGMASGVYLAALTMRYGVKGLVLAVVGIFPQYLLYIPAVLLLLSWCENLYRSIYSRSTDREIENRSFLFAKIGKLAGIGAIMVVGCMLEGYVNLRLLLGYLKIF